MSDRPDPMVEQMRIRRAAEHQAIVLPGLDNERLHLVAERLASDKQTDPAIRNARLAVVRQELGRRGLH